jgi:hypothetical protein
MWPKLVFRFNTFQILLAGQNHARWPYLAIGVASDSFDDYYFIKSNNDFFKT